MKSLYLKKCLLSLFITIFACQSAGLRAAEAQSTEFLDESLQDLTVVLGAGAAGAVLGLSTLSFVETPKDHFKNIAIGGAIGIVIGVGIVVFSQATKSSSSMNEAIGLNEREKLPLNSDSFHSQTRYEFSNNQKIAESYLKVPTFSYSLDF
jgi:hypothetical protein